MKLKVKDWEEFLSDMSTSRENKQFGEVTIPENVKIIQEGNIIIVEGKNGKIKKDFTNIPIKLAFEDNKIMIHPPGQRRKDLALINTVKSILSSMIKGVETGFTYKLKIIFSHFPISVKVKDKKVIVENYFGERSSRISKIVGDTQVEISGEDVIVKGPSLEDVSQTATNIESSTKIKNKDQRVFLDGVYVYAKQDGL